MGLILTVDTSTAAGSAALSRDESLLGEVFLNIKATHTDRLLVGVQRLLADTGVSIEEVEAFGVVLGPGSFTGLRVGVATVKGLALATGKPVVGVSSLAALALQAGSSVLPVCALLDARKKEVYAGLFRVGGGLPEPLGPEAVLPPEELLERLPPEVLFIGDGAIAYRTLIVRRFGAKAHFLSWPQQPLRAASAAALSLDALRSGREIPLHQLRPHYLRPSEAELLWAGHHGESGVSG